MRRMLGAAAPALVLLCLAGSAAARTHVYARVKCVGLYCAIVTEPEPRPAPRPATWRRGWSNADPKRISPSRAVACHPPLTADSASAGPL